jgi:hypothetical protein
MASLTCLAFGAPVGTADPSGSNEQGPLSSPEWSVVVSVAAEPSSREGNVEEGGDGGE